MYSFQNLQVRQAQKYSWCQKFTYFYDVFNIPFPKRESQLACTISGFLDYFLKQE